MIESVQLTWLPHHRGASWRPLRRNSPRLAPGVPKERFGKSPRERSEELVEDRDGAGPGARGANPGHGATGTDGACAMFR